MNRTLIIVLVSLVATASVSAAVILKQSNSPGPSMTVEQKLTREKFFGSKKEHPPIEKGQEMRPRW